MKCGPFDFVVNRQTSATQYQHGSRVIRAPRPPGVRRPLSTATEQWTPAHTAFLLKVALYIGAGAGVWWLMRSTEEHDELDPSAGEQEARDYLPWEPEP